ncbi:MAG: hypothetical protein JXA22_05695 [Candidatus Thermoplasmatota archaeon]|nr:hypothetical protein [Candidatus Thermoplasmatota archaeon]
MKLLVGSQSISRRIQNKLGTSKLVLFKFGKGSGGDTLLKQFFDTPEEDNYSVMISTHQTGGEMMEEMADLGIESMPELVSILPLIDRRLSALQKRDRFISEGIMVTDLLEISSNSSDRTISMGPHLEILSKLTEIITKQVLPFRLVLDSLVDLVEETSSEEVIDRMRMLKKALREKGGLALIGCPLDDHGLSGQETTLFDAVIEVRAEKRGNNWSRSFTFLNIKGSIEPPEEFPITMTTDIPTAMEVE